MPPIRTPAPRPSASRPPAPGPTEVERWLERHLPLEWVESARGLYELMPRQRGGQLPLVDVPYDPGSEEHWAEAARIADYVAHVPPQARRVLDVGPGDGWPVLPIAAARPELAVIGVDPSPRRTAVCRANARRLRLPNARFLTADASRLPVASDAIDLVTAASSLEEAADPQAVFRELARVLRPGGVLRASYQDWRLGVPEFESVLLWDGRLDGQDVLLYSYVRRVQTPAIERRYTIAVPDAGEAARLHRQALLAAAGGRRAYGETLLLPALGVLLLEQLAPHVLRATVVEMRRWTTEWLAEALVACGFTDVRTTVHPGELARHFARDLLSRDAMESFVPLFEDATRALGALAGGQPGRGMVAASR